MNRKHDYRVCLLLSVLLAGILACGLGPKTTPPASPSHPATLPSSPTWSPTATEAPPTLTPTATATATPTPLPIEEFAIRAGPGERSGLDISNNIVVWSEKGENDWNIIGFDISSQSTFAITDHDGNQFSPAIDGSTVVWEDHRAAVNGADVPRIYGLDLNTRQEFPVTAGSSPQWQPDISGNIVVFKDWRDVGTCSWGDTPLMGPSPYCDWDIWGTNLETHKEFPITTEAEPQFSPQISGNWVIWEQSLGNSSEISVYQLGSNVPPRKFTGLSSPSLDGNILVYKKNVMNGQSGIFGYYLSTGNEFLIASGDDKSSPTISKNIVAWVDRRNGNNDIYGYNLATGQEFAICTAPGDQESPVIDGNIAVWIDQRNNDTEIYGAKLSFTNEEQTDNVVGIPTWTPAPTPAGQLRTFTGHTSGVTAVEWSPDGQTLASGSYDGTVILWDAVTGARLHILEQTGGFFGMSVAWSPDGQMLASGGWGITLWEAATGRRIRYIFTDDVSDLAWSPDGKIIAYGGTDKKVTLVEAASGKPLRTFEGHTGFVESVAWSPDGTMIASGGGRDDNSIILWDVTTGERLRTIQSGSVTSLAWSPDGQTIASGDDNDHTVHLWNTQTGELLRELEGHNSFVTSLAWSPDGRILASGSNDDRIMLWDINTGRRLITLKGHSGSVKCVDWSPDGTMLVSGSSDTTIIVWNVAK